MWAILSAVQMNLLHRVKFVVVDFVPHVYVRNYNTNY